MSGPGESADAGDYRSTYSSSGPKLQHVNAFETNDKVWMKDTDGFFTVLAWVVEKQYNQERDGWDYWVMRKDVSQTNWLEGGYWRAETELRKA